VQPPHGVATGGGAAVVGGQVRRAAARGGLDDIRLLVSRPPQTLHAAQPIAAEHFAFSDDAHKGLRGVGWIARAMVNNPFWDFWWD